MTNENDACEICNNIDDQKFVEYQSFSKRAAITIGVCGGLFASIYALTIPFVAPAFRKICLPYVPATSEQVKNVFTALNRRSGSLIDIGSGDGRIVLHAAKQGFKASGVELNYWLVLYSRLAAWRNGLFSQTKYFRKDLWKTDLSRYDNVVVFGVEDMMPKLENKLKVELNKNGQVVACRFPLPTWEVSEEIGEGLDTVWLYVKQTDPKS